MNDNYYSYNQYGSNVKTSTTALEFAKSYLWMFIGVLITLSIGYLSTYIISSGLITNLNPFALLLLFGVCFILEIIMCVKIRKKAITEPSFSKALLTFVAFSAINGLMFSFIFIYFDLAILNQVFIGVAIYFLVLSVITFLFRNKIHKMSGFAFAGLSVLLIASLLMWLFSFLMYGTTTYYTLYLGISILGIVIFTIITMVDIRHMYTLIDHSYDKRACSVLAALTLYLDFINIFIYILRILLILGKNVVRKD